MSSVERQESGMTFSFDSENVYFPEKSEPYISISGKGVKTCDFIVSRPEKSLLLFLEAKTSAPKVENCDKYVQDFHSRVSHSLLLLLGIDKKRPYSASPSPIPPFLNTIAWDRVSIKPVLIVKNHELDWIPDLQDKIREEMRGTMKAFSMEMPSVINEKLARETSLVR